MALPQGLYFRATNNQTSPTDYEAEIGTTANYPRTTAKGVTVGWETASRTTRDRDLTTDVRLKGIHFGANSGTADYRIDLPSAGTYNIRAAFGDHAGGNHIIRFRCLDTSTVLFDHDTGNVPVSQWADATGVIRTTEANWVSNNAIQTATFSTTIFRARMGGSTGSSSDPNWAIAALYIESAGGVNTYSYTATGGVVLGGASSILRGLVRASSGGLLFSGTAPVSFSAAVQSLIVVATGGISFSGASTKIKGIVRAATGGLIFGGSAAITLTPDPNPTTLRAFKRGHRPRTRKNY